MKGYKILFIVGLLVLFIVPCGEDQNEETTPAITNLEKIQQRGKLIAVTQSNSTDYFINGGEPMGYQLELLQSLSDYLGLKLELITKTDINSIFSEIKNNKYDLVAINLAITKERQRQVSFTLPLMQTRQVLVQKKPDNYQQLGREEIEHSLLRNKAELEGKVIYVQKGTSYINRLKEIEERIGQNINIIERKGVTDEQLIKMVAHGDVNYTVCDRYVAKRAKLYFPNIDINTSLSNPQSLAWAVQKNSNVLLDTINDWIRHVKKTKRYEAIYNRYFKRGSGIANSGYIIDQIKRFTRYEYLIKQQSDELNWDWRLLAALIYQESRFKPYARSWKGAYGLMQLMPTTAQQFGAGLRSAPRENIMAGVKFLKWLDLRLRDIIKDREERIKFILAAYNAGLGHVLDARRLAKKYGRNPNEWEDNVDYFVLKKSTPKYYRDSIVKYGYLRGSETYNYVYDIMERYEHYKNAMSG